MSGANAAVIAVLFRRARRTIADHFERAGAFDPEHATTYRSGSGAERITFARMRSAGAIREQGENRFYIDRPALAAFEAERGRVKMVLLAAVAIGAAALAALG